METPISSIPWAQSCRLFSVDEIQSATRNFNDALVVGKGGFGKVYKATVTIEKAETSIVAIKRLNFDSSQGATEFLAEIEMLTKLRHCNLVSLIGYCNDNSEMILVYEFMSNGTLDDHLHRKGTNLSWVQRLKISIGAARGLEYLHTGTGTKYGVIHRDVKSTNILLDEDYVAKISDFRLAKFGPTDTSGAFVETRVRGTFGYLDPEYTFTGRLTRKSDVFAFGVVLFELLCGRVAVLDNRHDDTHEISLVKWVVESVKKKKVHDIIDLKIKSQISPKCLKEFVQIAYRCLSSESENRPKMVEIVVALELSLTLQKKFDSPETPAAGLLSIGRMIKWPLISPEVNSVKTGPSITTVAVRRISNGIKALTEGGYDNIFEMTFKAVPDEKLVTYYACCLSTSAGPVMGILYLSTAKLAFCSDNPHSYKVGEETHWSYDKVVIPLNQLKEINASKSKLNVLEKCI